MTSEKSPLTSTQNEEAAQEILKMKMNKKKKKTKRHSKSLVISATSSVKTPQTKRSLNCYMCGYKTGVIYALKKHLSKTHKVNRTFTDILRYYFRQGSLEPGYHCEFCVFRHEKAAVVYEHYQERHPARVPCVEYVSTQLYAGPGMVPPKKKKPNLEQSEGNDTENRLLSQRSGQNRAGISCKRCSFKSKSLSDLAHHYRIVHPLSAKLAKKANASWRVEDQSDRRGSSDSYQFGKLRASSTVFKCLYCSANFNSKHGLHVHCGLKHPEAVIEKYEHEHEQEQKPKKQLQKPKKQLQNSKKQLQNSKKQLQKPKKQLQKPKKQLQKRLHEKFKSSITAEESLLIYKCPKCPYVNASYHATLAHCQMKHPAIVVRADELETDEVFASNMVKCTLGKGSNERGYLCKKCSQIHGSLRKLNAHRKKVHHDTEVYEHTDTESQPVHTSQGSAQKNASVKNKTSRKVSIAKSRQASQTETPDACPSTLLSGVRSNKQLYKCQMCTYKGANRKYLQCHYKNTHKLDAVSIYKLLEKYNVLKSGNSTKVKCLKCPDLTFKSSQLLIDHYSTFHRSEWKLDFTVLSLGSPKKKTTGVYKCDHCNTQLIGIRKVCYHMDHHRARMLEMAKAAQRKESLVSTTIEQESSKPCRQDETATLETVNEVNRWNGTPVPSAATSELSDVQQPELESNEDKHTCKQCGRMFMSLKGLHSHEHSHAALAAIKKLDNSSTSGLKHNISKYLIHKSGTLRSFQCSCCTYRTTVFGLWRSHFMKKHRDLIMGAAETEDKDESEERFDKEFSNSSEKMNSLPEIDEGRELIKGSLYLEPPDVRRQLNHYTMMAQSSIKSKVNMQLSKLPENSVLHCEFCNFSTGHLSSIRRHCLNWHGKKILRCKDCNFFTGLRKTLEMHMETGHSTCQSKPTHQKDLCCPFCLYQTKNKNNMIDHIVLHREGRLVPIEVRRPKLSRYLQGIIFRCHKCTFTSGSPENLRLHMMRHDDIKPYKCRLCYFDCTQLSDLEAHLSDKHQVVRNHELVGQVSLDQLEPSVGNVPVTEEEHLSNMDQLDKETEDVEMEDFFADCDEVPQAENLEENYTTEKSALQMRECQESNGESPGETSESDIQHENAKPNSTVQQELQEQAEIVLLETAREQETGNVEQSVAEVKITDTPCEDCGGPEEERQTNENQTQPKFTECGDKQQAETGNDFKVDEETPAQKQDVKACFKEEEEKGPFEQKQNEESEMLTEDEQRHQDQAPGDHDGMRDDDCLEEHEGKTKLSEMLTEDEQRHQDQAPGDHDGMNDDDCLEEHEGKKKLSEMLTEDEQRHQDQAPGDHDGMRDDDCLEEHEGKKKLSEMLTEDEQRHQDQAPGDHDGMRDDDCLEEHEGKKKLSEMLTEDEQRHQDQAPGDHDGMRDDDCLEEHEGKKKLSEMLTEDQQRHQDQAPGDHDGMNDDDCLEEHEGKKKLSEMLTEDEQRHQDQAPGDHDGMNDDDCLEEHEGKTKLSEMLTEDEQRHHDQAPGDHDGMRDDDCLEEHEGKTKLSEMLTEDEQRHQDQAPGDHDGMRDDDCLEEHEGKKKLSEMLTEDEQRHQDQAPGDHDGMRDDDCLEEHEGKTKLSEMLTEDEQRHHDQAPGDHDGMRDDDCLEEHEGKKKLSEMLTEDEQRHQDQAPGDHDGMRDDDCLEEHEGKTKLSEMLTEDEQRHQDQAPGDHDGMNDDDCLEEHEGKKKLSEMLTEDEQRHQDQAPGDHDGMNDDDCLEEHEGKTKLSEMLTEDEQRHHDQAPGDHDGMRDDDCLEEHEGKKKLSEMLTEDEQRHQDQAPGDHDGMRDDDCLEEHEGKKKLSEMLTEDEQRHQDQAPGDHDGMRDDDCLEEHEGKKKLSEMLTEDEQRHQDQAPGDHDGMRDDDCLEEHEGKTKLSEMLTEDEQRHQDQAPGDHDGMRDDDCLEEHEGKKKLSEMLTEDEQRHQDQAPGDHDGMNDDDCLEEHEGKTKLSEMLTEDEQRHQDQAPGDHDGMNDDDCLEEHEGKTKLSEMLTEDEQRHHDQAPGDHDGMNDDDCLEEHEGKKKLSEMLTEDEQRHQDQAPGDHDGMRDDDCLEEHEGKKKLSEMLTEDEQRHQDQAPGDHDGMRDDDCLEEHEGKKKLSEMLTEDEQRHQDQAPGDHDGMRDDDCLEEHEGKKKLSEMLTEDEQRHQDQAPGDHDGMRMMIVWKSMKVKRNYLRCSQKTSNDTKIRRLVTTTG
ncbi:uncharacterized protein LOC112841881 [Oreochromis niloticus]|uniref:uncharacterized protein LOC112841881 n=1 Tax=Oreochromis niloticus TaxID=8128 RepID=UPI000DF3160F|nr:uncharacterized protein LOC112841881 [Oreochromis niloticus]